MMTMTCSYGIMEHKQFAFYLLSHVDTFIPHKAYTRTVLFGNSSAVHKHVRRYWHHYLRLV